MLSLSGRSATRPGTTWSVICIFSSPASPPPRLGCGTASRSGRLAVDETVTEPLMLSRWPAPRPSITDWIMDDLASTNYSCGQPGLLTERDNGTTGRSDSWPLGHCCVDGGRRFSRATMTESYVGARITQAVVKRPSRHLTADAADLSLFGQRHQRLHSAGHAAAAAAAHLSLITIALPHLPQYC